MPFSRDTRAVVYQRAKMELDKRPFGTQEDVYRDGYEWMHHSMAPKTACQREVPHHHRRPGLHEALFGLGLQHLGDELRRAQPQRGARAERRRQEGRLRARHRRGRRQPLSPRERRRPHLGDRLRLFRLPQPRRHASIRSNSPTSPPTTRSRWSSSRSARAPSPAMAACCRRPRSPRRFRRIRGVPMGEDCISPAYAQGLLDAARNDGVHRRDAAAVRRQAGRLQAVHRPSLGVPGDLQGDAGDRDLSRLHRGRRQRRRHRRGAAGIHGPSRHADARGRQLRAQCADRHRRARPHPDRRLRQDHHRLRHGARHGARRRLVQFGARLHVRAGLHPVAELPHRPLPDRRHHAGSARATARWWCRTRSSGCTIIITPRCMRWPS